MSSALRVVFMGTPQLSVGVLETLLKSGHFVKGVLTRPEKRRGRGMARSASPVAARAAREGIPVLCPLRLSGDEFLEAFRNLGPDVLVGAAFGALVPKAVLEIPRFGALNLHPSLLPRYRGPAPVQRALMQGERVTGVTVHFLDAGMDSGDIVLQEETEIRETETAGELAGRLFKEGGRLMVRALDLLAVGEAPRLAQDEADATYACALDRSDEEIPWDGTAKEVSNRIRALNPEPGAYTTLRGRRIKVWRAGVSAVEGGQPGLVISLQKGLGFVVATSKGSVLVKEVQPAGKQLMAAWDFCLGRYVVEGDILGT